MDEISIAIHIAGRQYRLRAEEKEKEQIEEAARRINRSIRLYAENFAYKDNQDLLAMVSLQQTLNVVECEDALEGMEGWIRPELDKIGLMATEDNQADEVL
jgi:cell division protein ZapA (FtsZ GTPase activity inhibitor)